MFRYRLRTLLILMALGPPLLSAGWWTRQKLIERQRQHEFDELISIITATVKPYSRMELVEGSFDDSSGSLSISVGTGQTVHEQPSREE